MEHSVLDQVHPLEVTHPFHGNLWNERGSILFVAILELLENWMEFSKALCSPQRKGSTSSLRAQVLQLFGHL